jgi:hypothetical protein
LPVAREPALDFGGDERLIRFVESEWPQVDGECLGQWACREDGYGVPYVSWSGPCGWRHYEAYADRPDILARSAHDHAMVRWRQARVNWLKDRGLDWVDVWIGGCPAASPPAARPMRR